MELLVVVGIIAVLISITIPVVSKVIASAKRAETQNFINQISASMDRYQLEFHSYPGPIPNEQIYNSNNPPAITLVTTATGFDTTLDATKITMNENVVLGLLGGLRITVPAGGGGYNIVYDPSRVGSGAAILNPLLPKTHEVFLDAKNLSWRTDASGNRTGKYQDEAAAADDSVIPEFVDSYSDPMPLLILRAKVGAGTGMNDPTLFVPDTNPIITQGSRTGQYDVSQFLAYTKDQGGGKYIGIGRRAQGFVDASGNHDQTASDNRAHGLSTAVDLTTALDKPYPLNAYPYFASTTTPYTAKSKDKYIIISAGADRIYGTHDDICTFGEVGK